MSDQFDPGSLSHLSLETLQMLDWLNWAQQDGRELTSDELAGLRGLYEKLGAFLNEH
jgi:hypothetical protein